MAGPLLIRGGLAIMPTGPELLDVRCESGRITAVGRDLPMGDARVLDAAGRVVGPGFIDVHTHGGGGFSFDSTDPAAVRAYAAWAPRHGLTSFLLSTVARGSVHTVASLAALRPALGAPGAEPLGFHLEGPFLNPRRRGAFLPGFLLPPSAELFQRLQDAAGGAIRQVTLAPELDHAVSLIEASTSSGAVAAMGHTDATAAEARAAFAAGITHVTHLFNAMRPFHHRDPGAVVAALLQPAVTCELICDGVHVAPDALRLAFAHLGERRLVLVTDNMALAGTGDRSGQFAGGSVTAGAGAAARPGGTLVGSLQPISQQVRNLAGWLTLDAAQVFSLAAANPAAVAGFADRKGSLLPGMDADIVILDHAWGVVATICRGEIAYQRPG